jgi:hypothetical protein
MNLRDFVRLTVAKTNPYWPFSTLNKIPYSLAIKAFLRMAKKFPEIKSVYLRHGLLTKDWVPAISDVDLTVIMESELKVEQEFAFLTSFWSQFKALKSVFPMLGEIDILDHKQFEAWVSITIRGYEAKDWALLSGEQTLPEITARAAETLRFESMDHAMNYYLDIVFQRLFQEGPLSPLIDYEMRRISSKIFHYIYYGESVESRDRFLHPLDCIAALVKNFDDRLQTAAEKVPASSENKSGWERVVSSVILSHNRDVLVLRDGVEIEAGFDWKTVTDKFVKGRKRPPAIVSKKMFEYMVRFFDPFFYSHLPEDSHLLYGNHPLQDVSPPEISSFIRCIFTQVPNVVAFPQTPELISPDLYSSHSQRRLDSMLEHALFIKLYLEKGLISGKHSELLSASQEHYSEYHQELDRLKQLPSNFEKFRFWKALAQEVYDLKPLSMNQQWKH